MRKQPAAELLYINISCRVRQLINSCHLGGKVHFQGPQKDFQQGHICQSDESPLQKIISKLKCRKLPC